MTKDCSVSVQVLVILAEKLSLVFRDNQILARLNIRLRDLALLLQKR